MNNFYRNYFWWCICLGLMFTPWMTVKVHSLEEKTSFVDLAVSVKGFGAVGDGVADDTVAVQKAIEAVCISASQQKNPSLRQQRTVVFPAGTYRITSSIRLLPQHMNLVLKGSGGAQGAKNRANTQLVWDGEKNGILLDVYGVSGLQLYDLFFDGAFKAKVLLRMNSVDSANNDPSILTLPEHSLRAGGAPARGQGDRKAYGIWSSALWFLDRVTFEGADTGIECGGDSWTCASDMTLNDVSFHACHIGFVTLADQNLNYIFSRPGVSECDIGLYFKKGGSVKASMLSGYSCGVAVKIDRGGINAGNFAFDVVRVEARTFKGKRTTLFDINGEVNVRISSMLTTGMGLSGDNWTKENKPGDILPLIKVSGGAMVLVQSSLISGKIASIAGSGSEPSWMEFNNCRFRIMADPRKDIYCEGNASFAIINSIVYPDLSEKDPMRAQPGLFIRDYRSGELK